MSPGDAAPPLFLLYPDPDVELEADFDEPLLLLDEEWAPGQPLAQGVVPRPVVIEVSGNGATVPDYLPVEHWAVVSRAFAEALLEAGADNLQLFPAVVHHAGTSPDTSRALMNVVGRVSCIDADRLRTRTTRDTGRLHVDVLALASRASTASIGEIATAHEMPAGSIVTDRVRQQLEGLTGFSLAVPTTDPT